MRELGLEEGNCRRHGRRECGGGAKAKRSFGDKAKGKALALGARKKSKGLLLSVSTRNSVWISRVSETVVGG